MKAVMEYDEAVTVLKTYIDWLNEKDDVKCPPKEKRIEALNLSLRTLEKVLYTSKLPNHYVQKLDVVKYMIDRIMSDIDKEEKNNGK